MKKKLYVFIFILVHSLFGLQAENSFFEKEFREIESLFYDTIYGRDKIEWGIKKADSISLKAKQKNQLHDVGRAYLYKAKLIFHAYLYSKPYFDTAYFYLKNTPDYYTYECELYVVDNLISQGNSDSALIFMDKIILSMNENIKTYKDYVLYTEAIVKKAYLLFNLSKPYESFTLLTNTLDLVSNKSCPECEAKLLLVLAKKYESLAFSKESIKKTEEYFKRIHPLNIPLNSLIYWEIQKYRFKYTFYNKEKTEDVIQQMFQLKDKLSKTIYINQEVSLELEISRMRMDLGQFSQADSMLDHIIIKNNIAKDTSGLFNTYLAKAYLYVSQNKFDQSVKYYHLCLQQKLKENNALLIIYCYKGLYNAYYQQNKATEALKYLHLYSHLKDSVYGYQQIQNIQDFLEQVQVQKNEERLNEVKLQSALKQQNSSFKVRLMFLMMVIILLLGILLYMNAKNATKRVLYSLQETEQKLLRAQMTPHFLSNVISHIQGISNTNKEKSYYYSSIFSKLMRGVLESTTYDYILLSKELELLQNYIEIQKLVTSKSIVFKTDISPDILLDAFQIPTMLLQPLIENSIKHYTKSGDLKINLHIRIENSYLCVELTDNGSGIQDFTDVDERTSYSMHIINRRIYLLNKKYKSKILFTNQNISHQGIVNGFKISYLFPPNIYHT